jgi:hypothetical protein
MSEVDALGGHGGGQEVTGPRRKWFSVRQHQLNSTGRDPVRQDQSRPSPLGGPNAAYPKGGTVRRCNVVARSFRHGSSTLAFILECGDDRRW